MGASSAYVVELKVVRNLEDMRLLNISRTSAAIGLTWAKRPRIRDFLGWKES